MDSQVKMPARAQAIESLDIKPGDAVMWSHSSMPAFVPDQRTGQMQSLAQRGIYQGHFWDEYGNVAVRIDETTGEGKTVRWVFDVKDVRMAAVSDIAIARPKIVG